MGRQQLGKVVVIVLTVAVLVRLAPLLWTPYPFNPDGFVFAAQARDTVTTGMLARDLISAHGYVFPMLLSLTTAITGVAPLWLAQPIIAIVGALPPVFAALFVWRLADHRPSETAITLAALAAGLTLALEGVYLRRTVTVSYEVLGLLFVVLVAVSAHRFLHTRQPRWATVTLAFLLVLPITHHLSTFMAALTLTGLIVLTIRHAPRRALAPGLAVLIPFWGYVVGYYALTQPSGYSDDLAAKPGLFVAWVIVLSAGALWLARSTDRATRAAVGTILLGGFAILGANAVWDLFPATARTPPRLLGYVAPLLVVATLTSWGLPLAAGRMGDRPIVLALLGAPLAWVGFAVTAGADPVYTSFAQRGQTFVHLAAIVCAGLAIVALGRRTTPQTRTVVTVGLPILLCLCALVSLPFAFSGLEALSYQGTTTSEEFESATFAAHTLDGWTSDDHMVRVAGNYYRTNATRQPTTEWLHDGGELRCPMVMQASWQTVGAQQFPEAPQAVEHSAYQGAIQAQHTVYTTTGSDPVTVVVPTGERAC